MLPPEMRPPAELVAESALWGSRAELVQGAGGNLSAKTDGVIWIKASGTRLADVDRPIYLPLDLAAIRAAVLETEDLNAFSTEIDGVVLRPSIETALHALLPYRYVTHLHSTGVIARAVTADARNLTAALPIDADLHFIPYAKPGVPLAEALLDSVGAIAASSPLGLVAVLGNHGLLVADDDLQRLVDRVFAVAAHWPCPPLIAETITEGVWLRIAPPGWLDEAQAAALCAGVLTPDEAVFLGPEPWGRVNDKGSIARARIGDDGSVWIADDLSADAAQIATSFAEIARQITGGAQVLPLNPSQVAELIDWEAEKWRKAMER